MPDLMAMVTTLPGVGPYLGYLMLAIIAATLAVAVLPEPKAGGNPAYAAVYNLLHIIANLKPPVLPSNGGKTLPNATSAAGSKTVPVLVLLALGVGLSACTKDGNFTPQAANVANNSIVFGQLFCAYAGVPGVATVVRVVAEGSGVPVTVTDKTAAVVAAACPVIAGMKTFPVSPPADPAAAPVVAAPVVPAKP